MDQTAEQNLRSTDNAAEKLRRDREEQGAKQLTPERRASLLERGEGIRRQLAAIEAKRTRDQERQKIEAEADQTAVQRLGAALKKDMREVARKVAGEGTELLHLTELRATREEQGLLAEESAVQVELMSGTTHEAEAPHGPEETVHETSKELTPDLRTETAGQSEQPAANIPPAN